MSLGWMTLRRRRIGLLVLVAGSAITVLLTTTNPSAWPLPQLTGVARDLAVPLFLAAGVLRVARWRITDELDCALRGAAMLLMGGLCLPSTAIARDLSAHDASPALVPFTRALTAAAVLYVVAVALTDQAETRPDLERRVIGLTAITATIAVLVFAVHGRVPPDPSIEAALARGVVIALAAAWLVTAAGAAVMGRDAGWGRRAAPLLACMGLAELCRLPDHPATTFAAATLTAAVAGVVAGSALLDLVRAAEQEHTSSQQLTRALAGARADVSTRDTWRAELSHDARGTLAGIRAAMATLEKYGDRIDEGVAIRLRGAALAELGHLEHLLVRQGTGTAVAFEVGDVLGTVIEARRATGLEVGLSADRLLAWGVPGDLATVMQNLLVNAQQHAPGAPVSVAASAGGGRAVITVTDRGPGMTDQEASAAFESGHRGLHSQGSGLGLFIARRLIRQQGGEIELREHVHGTMFVVSLPLVHTAAALAPIRSPLPTGALS